jgi:hypothetical protein
VAGAAGWRDFRRAPLVGVLHGLALALFGAAFWLLSGAFSGFLVVAPVLATGLYALSRALERGEPANWTTVRKTWTRWQYSRYAVHGGYWSLVRFGVLLALAGTGWVLTSAALITALAPQPVHTPLDFARHVVLAPGGHLFELWLTLGGLMAAPLFASSVVAMPLLLDRRVDVLQAVLTSWQAVLRNPGAAGAVGGAHHGPDAAGHGHRAAGPDRRAALAGPCQLARLPRAGRRRRPARAPAARRRRLMFGFSEEQIAWFGLTFGVSAFILYMLFIIGQLAWESKAGKFGTFVLFLALAFGMLGFVAKGVIQWIIEK